MGTKLGGRAACLSLALAVAVSACGSSSDSSATGAAISTGGGTSAGGTAGANTGGITSSSSAGTGGVTAGSGGKTNGGATGSGGTRTGAGGTPTAAGGSPTIDADSGASSANACQHPRPGPDNTGPRPGVVLKKSGSIKVEKDGEVVEGLDIAGMVTVLANDVTIRNVRITSGDYYPVRYFDNDNTGLVIEDSEIVGTSDDVTASVSFANYTARRLNIHGGADGFKADSNVLIEDCWVHDLRNGPEQHNDGVQSTGGKGVTLRHNDISGASNACVQTGDDGKVATEDLLVECNWLSGGGWTLNIRGAGATKPKGTKILDNRFGRDSGYGPWTLDDPNPTISGNVYDDNGEAIPD